MTQTTKQRARIVGQGGFSLVEMMVVVAIVGVMVAMGIPAFSRMIARNEVQQVARQIAAALQTTRLQAMNLNAPLAVLPALIPGGDGQMLRLSVLNANTGLAPVNPINGNTISAGQMMKAAQVTSITLPGGAPVALPVTFSSQGLLAPLGTPTVVWQVNNPQIGVVYSVTVTPGGRVRWCGVAVAAGQVCP